MVKLLNKTHPTTEQSRHFRKEYEKLSSIKSDDVIHKDINPTNIVWNLETNQIKLIDVGIATQLSRENPEARNPANRRGADPVH